MRRFRGPMKEDQRECEGSPELAKPFLMSLLVAM